MKMPKVTTEKSLKNNLSVSEEGFKQLMESAEQGNFFAYYILEACGEGEREWEDERGKVVYWWDDGRIVSRYCAGKWGCDGGFGFTNG